MAAIIALVLGVSSMLGLDAQPTTLYVAPSGSDRNDCLTPQTACAGFDAGYHAAAPGDVVEVQAGSYPPQLFSPDASKTSPDDVIVRPAPGARVIVGCDGPDNCLATEGADHLTVERIETAYLEPVPDVPSSEGPALRQGGVALDRGSEDVTFRDLDAGHLWFAAGDSRVIGGDYGPTVDEDSKIAGGDDGANQLIDGAYFHDHLLKDAHMQCIWLAGAQGVTIRRSRFDNCAVFSIFSTPEVDQHYKDVLIENNFFSNSGDVSMSTHVKVGSHGGDCTNFVMRNNTFVDENVISDCGADAGTATNIRWIGNIFESGGCGAPGHVFDYNVMENGSPCGPHDRKVDDVRFVDRAAQDLHLAAGSSAIGAGHPTDHPADDIDGDPRPSGVASDAGADAYVAGGGGEEPGNSAPTVWFTDGRASGFREQDLTLTADGADADPGPAPSLTWDLDDDGEFDDAVGATATTRFSSLGDHRVAVRATDSDNGTAVAVRTVTIHNRDPTVQITAGPATGFRGESLTFRASAADADAGPAPTLAWDLDDDGAFDDATGDTATASFDTLGGHELAVRATDADDGTSDASMTVQILNRAPSATIATAPAEGLRGEELVFTAEATDPDGSSTIAFIAWEVVGDECDDDVRPELRCTFKTLGAKTVRVHVTDDGGLQAHDEVTVQIVNRAPTVQITAGPASGLTGQDLTFTAAASDADPGPQPTLDWDLDGDNDFDDATGATATTQFATTGIKRVQVRATDSDDGTAVAERTVTIRNRAPSVQITAGPASGFRGQELVFTAEATDPDGTIASITWEVAGDECDDGTGAELRCTFETLGPKTIRLHVTDDGGLQADDEVTVQIVNRAPTAQITAGPASGFRGEDLTFTAVAEDADPGPAPRLAWDLDDDGQFDDATGATATTRFDALDDHRIAVRATDSDDGTAVAERTVTIRNRAPSVQITAGPASGFRGQELVFTAEATDPDGTIASITWEVVGDECDDGTGAELRCAFETLGPKTVRLHVTDDGGLEADDEVTVQILNRAPTAQITGPDTGFRGQELTFTASAEDVDPGPAPRLAWDLDDDGQFDDATGATATTRFDALDDHRIAVRATDSDDGTAVAERTVTIRNRAPSVQITAGPASGFRGQELTFTASAEDADRGPAPTLAWDLDDDGQFDDATGATATTRFDALDDHRIAVRATDSDDGTAVAERTVTILAPETSQPPPTTPSPAPDTRAPVASLKPLPKQRLRSVRSAGFRFVATCDRPCTAQFKLLVDKGTARRLKIDRRARGPVTVAELTATIAGGQQTVALKLTRKSAKAFKRARKVKLTLVGSVSDAAGNTTQSPPRTVTVKR